MGRHKFEEIKTIVTKEMVFSLFDLRPGDKRRLKIARFNDPNIAPHIYLRFLYAYGKFPNNDEVPQYFVKMLIAEFRLHMDPDYTDTRSPFYGAGKGRTYERPDSLRDVEYSQPEPRLVVPQPRVISFPEEFQMTSEVASRVRAQIKEHVMAALSGVEIGLHNSASSTNMDDNSFDDYSDDALRFMSRSELEKYAACCRDMYKSIKAQENRRTDLVRKYGLIIELTKDTFTV